MNIQQEKIDKLNSVLKVTVLKEDYHKNYTQTLKDYSKRMDLPGFRSGKVPLSVVKKKYGKGLLAEEIQKLLDQSIHDYITENELKVLGQPLPIKDNEVGDWDEPDEFNFSYELGLAPEFEVKVSSRHKINFYTVKVDDKMILEEVDRIRRRYGKLSDSSVSGDKDMLIGDLVELREDGLEKEEGIKNQTTIGIEYIEDKKIKKKLLGVKIGDSMEVDVQKLAKDHDDLGKMLGITHEEVHHLNHDIFRFDVKEVKQLTPAQMDEELFSKVLPEGKDKTEEGLKGFIMEGLKEHFLRDSEVLFKRDMNRYYSDKLKLKLPDQFLKKWIELSSEGKNTIEEIEASYEEYSNSIKWQLIKNKIIKEDEVKVEFTEALDDTKELLKQNYMQYGMPEPSDEELTETATGYLQDREQLESIFDRLYEKKVIDIVKERAKLNHKEVSFDKFKTIAEK